MAASHEAVGPFPPGVDPDAYDRLRRRILWLMPSGLYLLGSAAEGRRNLMTLNWATQVATVPKLVAVSVERAAETEGLVRRGGAFSLNILRRSDRAVVRKFVKPAPDDGATLSGFPVHTERTGAPIFDAAMAWLDCEVRHTIAAESHTLFVGEIVACGEGVASTTPGGDGDGDGDGNSAQTGVPGGDEVLRMEDTRMSYGG